MSAVISPCGQYRYRLERGPFQLPLIAPIQGLYGRTIAFFGVNPSTADASIDDSTVRKWTGFCQRWGAGRFIVGNIWPLRTAYVRELAAAPYFPDIARENVRQILAITDEADLLVPCWGSRDKIPRSMHGELDALLALLLSAGKPVLHFGRTKSGDPLHPLMLSYDTPLLPWVAD